MLGDGTRSLGLQLLAGTKAAVRLAFVQEPVGVLAVDIQPFRLPIRRVRTAYFRALIPAQAQPLQILNELRLVPRLAPVEVRVFNAEQELSPRVPGKQPVVESRPGIAHMQQSRRRGRESNARFLCVHTLLRLPSWLSHRLHNGWSTRSEP